jgi:hypothetical protein
MHLFRKTRLRRSILLGALCGMTMLAGCDGEQSKPSENNTYNVHLYYGKDVKEHKALGQVLGISRCKTAVHTQAARMRLKPHTYSYVCCWVHKGEACYEKHK